MKNLWQWIVAGGTLLLFAAGCGDNDEALSRTVPPQTVWRYHAPALTEPSGPRADGSGVLPNGRLVTPTGRGATVETLPLNLRVGKSGHLFVTNDGNGTEDLQRYLQVIDPRTMRVSRTPAEHFFGLAVSPDGERAYAANGPQDRVDVFAFDGTTLNRVADASITFPAHTFPTGIAISADGATLYAVGLLSNTFWRVDLGSGTIQQATAKIGDFPYTVVVSHDGRRAYVSSWGLNNGNPSSLVPTPLQLIYQLNPMTGVIQGFRWALLGNTDAPGGMFFVSVGLILLLLVSGAYVFRRTERTIVDIL